MNKLFFLYTVCVSLFFVQFAKAQTLEPEVGKPCPAFTFDKIDFFSKKQVTLDDFKGKWLVLDFWAKNCSSCIASFPRLSKAQEQFKDSLQIVMITYEDKEQEHRKMYAKFHKALNLQMPCAFAGTLETKGDSLEATGLWKQFNIYTLPHTLIIDPKGTVLAITVGLNVEKFKQLLAGEHPVFSKATFAVEKKPEPKLKFDNTIPFEVNNNGAPDSDFVYRSLISKGRPNIPGGFDKSMMPDSFEIARYKRLGKFEMRNEGLARLYMAAFTGYTWMEQGGLMGKIWERPILEMKDTSLFKWESSLVVNAYCYSLIVPPSKATPSFMMDIMQNDLKHYFGYAASMEVRKMPCWKLVATDKAKVKLKSKSNDPASQSFVNGLPGEGTLILKNSPVGDLLPMIESFTCLNNYKDPPLIDETGIEGGIDISVKLLKCDWSGIQRSLQKNGLDLVKGEKDMKVLVIRDQPGN